VERGTERIINTGRVGSTEKGSKAKKEKAHCLLRTADRNFTGQRGVSIRSPEIKDTVVNEIIWPRLVKTHREKTKRREKELTDVLEEKKQVGGKRNDFRLRQQEQ